MIEIGLTVEPVVTYMRRPSDLLSPSLLTLLFLTGCQFHILLLRYLIITILLLVAASYALFRESARTSRRSYPRAVIRHADQTL